MNKVLGLFDFENLLINTVIMRDAEMHLLPPEKRPSITSALTKAKSWIETIGEIYGLYVFAPLHVGFSYELLLYRLNFILITCPKIPLEKLEEKEREKLLQRGKDKKDTADEVLIQEGTKWLNNIPDITHVIIGSGDHGYETMLKEAKNREVKIGAVMGEDENSHSKKILELIDLHPGNKQPMLHIFSPTVI